MCIKCCDKNKEDVCGEPNEFGQCDFAEQECRKYNDDVCGIQYSSPEQAYFCEIEDPIVWPPSISIPNVSDWARAWLPNLVFFINADDKSVERNMQNLMVRDIAIADVDVTAEVRCSVSCFGKDICCRMR